MFPEKRKSYPGRPLVLALQVGLVIAIGLFGLIALRHTVLDESEDIIYPEPDSVESDTRYTYSDTTQPEPDVTTYTAQDYLSLGLNVHDDDHQTAIDYYTQALELDPNLTNAWLARGVAYERMNHDCPKSRNDLWQYVQLNTLDTKYVHRPVNGTKLVEMTEGRLYRYTILAKAGDTLNVNAVSVVAGQPDERGVVDPLLVLLDANETPLKTNDDTLNPDGSLITMDSSITDYVFNTDGRYTLLLTHAGGGSLGTVEFKVSLR